MSEAIPTPVQDDFLAIMLTMAFGMVVMPVQAESDIAAAQDSNANAL